jgi:hypothetical protein
VKYEFHVDVNFSEALEPYRGPDVNQKFAGEDDPVWCERCQTNHRRTAGWEIERERMIQKMARQLAARIDQDASNAIP